MCVLGWRSQLNITPIEEFLFSEAVRGSYRITVTGLWHVNPVGSFGKTKSHFDVCNESRRFLSLLRMSADQIKKTKVFARNFKCQIMNNKKNAIRSESVLNQNTVKFYSDGSKLDGRVGAGFYAEYPNNSPKQAFFHLGIYSTVFQVAVLAISEMAMNLLLEKMHNQSIVVLVDSQEAIKARIKCTVTSTRWEFSSKPSERPTHCQCCDAQKYFLSTVKSAIIQKYLIMEPPEK